MEILKADAEQAWEDQTSKKDANGSGDSTGNAGGGPKKRDPKPRGPKTLKDVTDEEPSDNSGVTVIVVLLIILIVTALGYVLLKMNKKQKDEDSRNNIKKLTQYDTGLSDNLNTFGLEIP